MKILCGDCAEVMKQIESDSIDLVVSYPTAKTVGFTAIFYKKSN